MTYKMCLQCAWEGDSRRIKCPNCGEYGLLLEGRDFQKLIVGKPLKHFPTGYTYGKYQKTWQEKTYGGEKE